MCQSSRALEKRAEENTWVSTWTGKQLVENKGSREATPESHGGGRLMECHDDRKRRPRESNVALQDLEKTTLSTRAARGGGRQWCWETTRPRASEHDWMMLETRSQKLGRGQRTVYEQAKTPEVQNTDDRRADPQRQKSGPTAGEKSIPNSRTSNRVMSVMNRADNTGADSPDSAQRISSPSTRSPTSLS